MSHAWSSAICKNATSLNYAQRSGRAGRSGQAALVLTYCAAQSPHDQYYCGRREQMVSGIVRPPAIDLANRDLIQAHLHGVWLAESALELQANIPHVLDQKVAALPMQKDIADAFDDAELTARAATAMRRILDAIKSALTAQAAPRGVLYLFRSRYAVRFSQPPYITYPEGGERWHP